MSAEFLQSASDDALVLSHADLVLEQDLWSRISAWYAGLSPRDRRAVDDHSKQVGVAICLFLGVATDSRPLALIADGLAIVLALLLLTTCALDTFDD